MQREIELREAEELWCRCKRRMDDVRHFDYNFRQQFREEDRRDRVRRVRKRRGGQTFKLENGEEAYGYTEAPTSWLEFTVIVDPCLHIVRVWEVDTSENLPDGRQGVKYREHRF